MDMQVRLLSKEITKKKKRKFNTENLGQENRVGFTVLWSNSKYSSCLFYIENTSDRLLFVYIFRV